MTLYRYRAVDPRGRRQEGQLEAAHLDDLEARLHRLGLDLIGALPGTYRRRGRGALGRRDRILLYFHLEQLLHAGLPLWESLLEIRHGEESPALGDVVTGLIEGLEGGLTLSQAMAHHPGPFPPTEIQLIRAGELSGRLLEILQELTETLKWEDEIHAQTRRLLLYPALLAAMVLGSSGFLLIYLVPQLQSFVRHLGHELPLSTRLLFALSDLLVYHGQALALGLLGLGCLGILLWRWMPRFQDFRDRWLLRLPKIGPLLEKSLLARFARSLALLYGAGISVLEGLQACATLVGNRHVHGGIVRVGEQIAAGTSLSGAFASAHLFPPLMLRMVQMGETTGALDQALRNVAYFYDRDIREQLGRLQALLEPCLTLILGSLLGWIMVAILGPIYDAVATLGH